MTDNGVILRGADEAVAHLLAFPSTESGWMLSAQDSPRAWNDWVHSVTIPLIIDPALSHSGLNRFISNGGSRKGFSQKLKGVVRLQREGQDFSREFDTWGISISDRIRFDGLANYLWTVRFGTEGDRQVLAQACSKEIQVAIAMSAGQVPRFGYITMLVAMLEGLDQVLAHQIDYHQIEVLLHEYAVFSEEEVYWPIPGVVGTPSGSETLAAIFLVQKLGLLDSFGGRRLDFALNKMIRRTDAPFSALLAEALLANPGRFRLSTKSQ